MSSGDPFPARESLLTRAMLIAAFVELDRRLNRDRVTADIFVFGGAALVLGFDARPATRDVDAVWKPHGAVLKHALAIADEMNMPRSWLIDQASFYLPSGLEPVGKVIFNGGSLRVMHAEPELLLAMKVNALRRRDEDDIMFLAGHLRLSDAGQIIALTERVLGEDLVQRKRALVEDLFAPGRELTPR